MTFHYFSKEYIFVIPIFCSVCRPQVTKTYYWQNSSIFIAANNVFSVGYVLTDVYRA